ncbi:MAG: TolC family protein [Bacteroides sp.]
MKYSISYKFHRILFVGLFLGVSLQLVAQQPTRLLPINELFQLGIENSLKLKASKIQETISDNQQKTALTQRLPNLQIGASAGFIGQPIVFQRGLSHPTRPNVPDWSQNYNVELSQPLYQGGKIRYNILKANLQKQIASIVSIDDQAEVKLFLLQQYINLFSYYKQRDVLNRNIEESERRLKDIRRMKKEGILTLNDELRSELQLTNDRLSYQEAENSIAIASQQLDILLGQDESLLIVPDTTLLYTDFNLQDYESYVLLAYEDYPGLQIARRNTQLAKYDTRLTQANYLPALSLHAGNTLARPLSSTMADMYNNNWNIGLSLSYNLSSLYQNKFRMHEAQQIVQLRRNAEEQLMQHIRIQIKNAYIRHQESLNRVEALKLSVKQAEENYRIVQNRYFNQLSILTDLLDAGNVRLEAELRLTTARTQTIYTYYELQRACGNL